MPKATTTKTTTKKAVKSEKPVSTVEVKSTKTAESTKLKLALPAVNLKGESQTAAVAVSPEVFGAKVNKNLLSQAARIYLNNQSGHFSNTKTRGEVEGSTAKMGPQKGSGRARHGSKRAPIFVGGGIALGPKFRKTVMVLPQKMKKAALISALSAKVAANEAMVIKGLEEASGKTKEINNLLSKVTKGSVLFVTEGYNPKVNQAVRNIQKVQVLPVNQINAFEILKYRTILLTDKAVEMLKGVKADVK